MAIRLNPYLMFLGSAREAMEFYQRIFGGELAVNTYGEFGSTDPAMTDKIMHAMLETTGGLTLMGADDAAEGGGAQEGGFAVSLTGGDAEELRGFFTALSDGGTVAVPLEKQMWGDEFGMCIDRFGVKWMVNVAAEQES